MNFKSSLTTFFLLVFLIGLILLTQYNIPGLERLGSPAYVRDFILGFGNLASVAYVLLLSIAIPLPTPSTPFILTGGFIFGALKGFILSMIGEILGATIAFHLIRFAGRPLLYRLARKSVVDKFNQFFKKEGLVAALISYAVPIFPSDVVSLVMGLTPIRYPLFLFLVIVGHLPRLIMINYFGADLYTGLTLRTLIASIIAIIFVLVIFFREMILRKIASKAKESKEKVVKKIKVVKGKAKITRNIRFKIKKK